MPNTRVLPAGAEEARRDCEAVTRYLRLGVPAVSVSGDTSSRSAPRAAADELGVNRKTFAERVGTPERPGSHLRRFGIQPDWQAAEKAAAERGERGFSPVLPGFTLRSTSTQRDGAGAVEREWIRQSKAPGAKGEIPPGHVVKGVSQLRDAEGRVTQEWVKTREGRSSADAVAEIREALADLPYRAKPVPAPPRAEDDLATVYACADWHLGLLTWREETGENWDLGIARQVIGETVGRLVAASPPSAQAVVLGLGDLLHADGYDNATPRSKNVLDVDGRYPKILRAATRLMIATVDMALTKHTRVLVRILPGNHDPESAVAVNLALALYYEDDPRVSVDDSPSPFWWWSWGATFLGATHGDAAKMRELPLIMASRNAEAWGRSRFRHILTGHIHSQTAIEACGVTVESVQTPIPPDAWHAREGYGGGRSLTSITYHRRYGETIRNKAYVLPTQEAA